MAEEATITVRQLRRRWKPQKERLARLQPDHPNPIRFHRACSWLAQAEGKSDQPDLVVIEQWIAFNALYGQWDDDAQEPMNDRASYRHFLKRIIDLDGSGFLKDVLTNHRRLVIAILDDEYLSRPFWRGSRQKHSASAARRARHQAPSWYYEERYLLLVEEVLDRIYLLRCQLVHGAATLGSQLNRKSIARCVTMMGHLLPAILQVFIHHGAEEDWGPMCYPPLDPRRLPARSPNLRRG